MSARIGPPLPGLPDAWGIIPVGHRPSPGPWRQAPGVSAHIWSSLPSGPPFPPGWLQPPDVSAHVGSLPPPVDARGLRLALPPAQTSGCLSRVPTGQPLRPLASGLRRHELNLVAARPPRRARGGGCRWARRASPTGSPDPRVRIPLLAGRGGRAHVGNRAPRVHAGRTFWRRRGPGVPPTGEVPRHGGPVSDVACRVYTRDWLSGIRPTLGDGSAWDRVPRVHAGRGF